MLLYYIKKTKLYEFIKSELYGDGRLLVNKIYIYMHRLLK